jgi:hypothetical protein
MTEMYNKPSAEKKDWQARLCERIKKEWDDGKTYTSSLNELYEDLYKMMRGKRPGKLYDWQSDISLRKCFQVVWTAVSYITRKMWAQTPVINVNGFDSKGCWQRERLLTVWMAKDKYYITMVLGLLRLLLNGVVIIKKAWNQELVQKERKGTVPKWGTEGTMEFGQDMIQSFPVVDEPEDIVLNNKDVVVDWMLKPGEQISKGRFVIHRFVSDLDALDPDMYVNLDKVEPQSLQGTSEAEDHASLRQEDRQESPPDSDYEEGEFFERQGLLPVKKKKSGPFEWVYDEDGDSMQMIVTMANKNNPVVVRFEPNPYGEIAYVSGHLFLDSERWQSQGMVEPAKDIYNAMDDNVNAMFDEIWKNLMPPVMMDKFAVQDWDSIKWAPSQIWLMRGNPRESVMIPRGSEITRDAYSKHQMLDSEGQLITSITPSAQGRDASNTATQGALNAQFSSSKLDFIVEMVEASWLVPSVHMTVRFAQKFAHPLTFISILGEAFHYDKFMEEYKFLPMVSSVKSPEQTEVEIREDIQLLQLVATVPNPNTPKIMNYLLGNILRNRDKPQLAEMFDEDFFEPKTDAGQMEMMQRSLGAGTASNEQGIPMSAQERSTRQLTYE